MSSTEMTEVGKPTGNPTGNSRRVSSSVFEDAESVTYKNEFTTNLNNYRESKLMDWNLWRLFRRDFRDWTEEEFNKCSEVTLIEMQEFLRERGVWVDNDDTSIPARSLHDVLLTNELQEWSIEQVKDHLRKGEVFTSRLIERLMAENNIYGDVQVPPKPIVQPATSPYMTAPGLHNEGIPSPTPTPVRELVKPP
jgi:hypothetical protein